MKREHTWALVTCLSFAAVFTVGAFGDAWFGGADYPALCQQECACSGCIVSDCVAKYEALAKGQGECASKGDAVAKCKVEAGGAQCESAGGWTMYMAAERCKPAIDELFACLHDRAESRAEAAQLQSIPAPMSFEDALRVICDAPSQLKLDALAPGERAAALARHVEQRVNNPRFELLFQDIAALPAPQREAKFKAALVEVGIEQCAFIDQLVMPPT